MTTQSLLMLLLAVASTVPASAAEGSAPITALRTGRFQWTASAPLVGPAPATDHAHAIKDPTVVFHEGRWHVFATLKTAKPSNMEHLSFPDWKQADAAPRHVISLDETYHCAPQVFFFRPHKKWYLIYQWTDRTPQTGFFGPAYSTMNDINQPDTLSKPVMLFPRKRVEHWIDFWVICDETHAYLFFTGDDGKFWRSRTKLADFPSGWNDPKLILQDKANEFFEATHTYRLKDLQQYLTLVEAIGPGVKRYYKAFLADRLDGEWQPVAGTWEKPFASINNVRFAPGVEAWTDSISHAELLRAGCDETLTVDPADLRLVFQGCSAQERAGKNYGQFPWRLGLLELAR